MFSKKKKEAPKQIPSNEIPILENILKEGLCQHAVKSKTSEIELNGVRLERNENEGFIIVSLKCQNEGDGIIQAANDQIENWIKLSLRSKGYDDIRVYYKDIRYDIYFIVKLIF